MHQRYSIIAGQTTRFYIHDNETGKLLDCTAGTLETAEFLVGELNKKNGSKWSIDEIERAYRIWYGQRPRLG